MKRSHIYTRGGDDGTTSLCGGTRVIKTDLRVEAYGTIDELNAELGLLATYLTHETDHSFIEIVQGNLFVIGAYLATENHCEGSLMISQENVSRLEQAIDITEDGLPPWSGFVLPGGSRGAAICHVCRTICRRAERRILGLTQFYEISPLVIAYVNRLSDYLFVLSRKMLFYEGKQEIIWKNR